MADQHQHYDPDAGLWRQSVLPALSLFTSLGTLVCCALPALLVTLGMGASLAGLVSSAPWLVALSEHKAIVFGGSAALLAVAGFMQWRARNAPCPIDPAKARACSRMRTLSWAILAFAVLVWAIGFFFAFVAVHIFY